MGGRVKQFLCYTTYQRRMVWSYIGNHSGVQPGNPPQGVSVFLILQFSQYLPGTYHFVCLHLSPVHADSCMMRRGFLTHQTELDAIRLHRKVAAATKVEEMFLDEFFIPLVFDIDDHVIDLVKVFLDEKKHQCCKHQDMLFCFAALPSALP